MMILLKTQVNDDIIPTNLRGPLFSYLLSRYRTEASSPQLPPSHASWSFVQHRRAAPLFARPLPTKYTERPRQRRQAVSDVTTLWLCLQKRFPHVRYCCHNFLTGTVSQERQEATMCWKDFVRATLRLRLYFGICKFCFFVRCFIKKSPCGKWGIWGILFAF